MRKISVFTTIFILLVTFSTSITAWTEEKTEILIPRLEDINSSRTTSGERGKFLTRIRKEVIEERFEKDLNSETEGSWPGAFWAAGLILERSDTTRSAITSALKTWDDRSDGFRRAALQAVYTLYPTEFQKEIRKLLPNIDSPKLFAMAGHYLLRNDASNSIIKRIRKTMISVFPKWKDDPILIMFSRDLESIKETEKRPPLADILAHKFLGSAPVVFSFQRHDRRYTGLAVIRDSSGRFLRRDDGTIFSIPQLAMSISGLPGYITNGNSPCGIYSIRGLDYSSNVFIGPTPFLNSRLPYEADVRDFFHDPAMEPEEWSMDIYLKMLPESWRDNLPIQEAFYAGKAGRGEIIAHGTTINPEFYRNEIYYPQTPSLGCLCAREIWSKKDGALITSDQYALVKSFRAAGNTNGFMIVIELDDRKNPVSMDEVIMEIIKAENTVTEQ